MANLIIDYTAPPALSNLTTIAAAGAIKLRWDSPISSVIWATEIWYATTNNRASATLLQTVVGTNSYTHSKLTAGALTYYYWVRAKGVNNQTNGAWFPSGSTSGVSGTVGLITTTDIGANAVTITSFGATNTGITGNGTYISALALTATNGGAYDLPYFWTFTGTQTYSSGARDTKWLFYDYTLSTNIFDFGTFTTLNELPALSSGYTIPAGATRQLILFWWGADSTVVLATRSFHVTGYLR